jgi:arsenite oxidase small subunit
LSGPRNQEIEKKRNNKRNFIKLVLTFGGIATVGSVASLFRILEYVPPPQGSGVPVAWPDVKVTNVSALTNNVPLRFNYPLVDTPCVMMKVGQAADGGVGPDSDIVAFSDLCQHLGCFYAVLAPGASPPCDQTFKAQAPQGYCCCHGGQYDFLHGAKVISGPPPRAAPQVTLRYDNGTGDIFATAMGSPTIFGHGPAGTSDPALVLQYDMIGGSVVTDATVLG